MLLQNRFLSVPLKDQLERRFRDENPFTKTDRRNLATADSFIGGSPSKTDSGRRFLNREGDSITFVLRRGHR